jgi:class 3 adenylate cyclase
MDFVMKVNSFDESTGAVEFTLEPDPRRYEWRETKEGRFLFDKVDNLMFPESVLRDYWQKVAGTPIFYEPQRIGDARSYAQSRRSDIFKALEGDHQPQAFSDKSEEFLESLAVDKLEFVIAVIDIVGSTKLATTMEPSKYSRLINTVLYELSDLVPKFHGHVLKYTGDGLIAYFPAPSFITKNDLAIDYVLSARLLIQEVLNPALLELCFPVIDLRIGLDSGEAFIATLGSPETKRHKDIIGSVVSLAAKIQALAPAGEIYLGETTVRNLYIAWRDLCERVDVGCGWGYKDGNGKPYGVWKVKIK